MDPKQNMKYNFKGNRICACVYYQIRIQNQNSKFKFNKKTKTVIFKPESHNPTQNQIKVCARFEMQIVYLKRKSNLQMGHEAQPIPASVILNEGPWRQHSQGGNHDHTSLQHQQGMPPLKDWQHNHELQHPYQ